MSVQNSSPPKKHLVSPASTFIQYTLMFSFVISIILVKIYSWKHHVTTHITLQHFYNTSWCAGEGVPSALGSLRERRTDRAAAAGVLVDSSVSAVRRSSRDARLLGSFSLTISGFSAAVASSSCGDGGSGGEAAGREGVRCAGLADSESRS